MHESWNDPISYRSKFRTDTAHHGTCSQIVLFSSHFYLIYFLVWEPPKVLIHLEITNILHNFNCFEDLKFIWKVKFSTLWCNNYYILFSFYCYQQHTNFKLVTVISMSVELYHTKWDWRSTYVHFYLFLRDLLISFLLMLYVDKLTAMVQQLNPLTSLEFYLSKEEKQFIHSLESGH